MRLVRRGLLAVLIVLGSYLGGVYVSVYQTFPFKQLFRPPIQAINAYLQRREQLATVVSSPLWNRTLHDATGLVRNVPEKSFGDYTFYTPANDTRAVLRDAEGEIVHTWSRPFREVWSDPPHTSRAPPEAHIFWRAAHLFSNGDVLALYSTAADSPYGYGLVKVNRESEVLWRYAEHTHHSIDVGPDGSIFVIAQQFRDTGRNSVSGVPQLNEMVLEDELVRLSSSGEEQLRVNLLDLLAESNFRALLEMSGVKSSNPASPKDPTDPLHTNDIDVVGEAFASQHEFAAPDDVLVSIREHDAILLVDMEESKITWASRGFWWAQHDPDPLPNGNIMVFDNKGSPAPGGRSRIIEFDPRTNAVEWTYSGTPKDRFHTAVRGTQQPLPNGNVLVTSYQGARIFEVSRAGNVVWDFRNPTRRMRDGEEFTVGLMDGQRVREERLEFTPDASR